MSKRGRLLTLINSFFFFIRIYFIRTSRLKFAKFEEYFKNKAEA